MIDFGYTTIYFLYKNYFNDNIGDILVGVKIFSISFFLLNAWSNVFNKIKNMPKAEFPFDKNKVVQSFLMVLIIIFYDKLLSLLDTILINFDSTYADFSPLNFSPKEEEITENDLASTAMQMLKQAASEFLRILRDPLYILLKMLEGVAWIIDSAIYGVFLFERFFIIGVLKILGAIAILLAVFEKYRDLFFNWLKLYISVYLLIIPFFMVIGFTKFIFNYFDNIIGKSLLPNASIPLTILLCILIWLKLRLFKKSYEVVYKIFEK